MDLLSCYEEDEEDVGNEVNSEKRDEMSLQRANVPQETYSDEESDIEDDDEDNDTERSKEPIEKTPVYNVEVDNLDVDKYPENSLDAYITKMKIPISNQVDLGGHSKAVSCFSIEPTGNRVVTGSLDYTVKIFDFGGMDSRHRSFKSLEAEESHLVVAISHSPSGDRFVVATGSAQPKVYDRDGNDIIKFVRGDMYLRDLSNTKGNTMEVTGVQWHPTDKNVIMTSSLDGSLRIWDLLGEASFGNLMNKHVLKIRGATGQMRVGATCCCFSSNGLRMVGGATDGTIHIWNQKKLYTRADIILKPVESAPLRVPCGVVLAGDNNTLAVRYEGGLVALWDILRPKAPLKVMTGMVNDYPTANVEFSPDSKLICCGTSPVAVSTSASCSEVTETKSRLYFFEVAGEAVLPCMHIAIAAGVSAVMVKWQKATNQIYCSLSSGAVRVLYDPRWSKKGALLSAHKAPKREKDPTDYALVGEIQNPMALPMYKTEMDKGLKRRMELKDPVVAKIPFRPPTQGPGAKENSSFFFTNYVMSERGVDTSRTEDPREALLKMDDEAKADPRFLGNAYKKSQPKTLMHSQTFEQEQEAFKKEQKNSLNKYSS